MAWNPHSDWKKYLPADYKKPQEPMIASGILLVDKPSGISSMDVLRVIKIIGNVMKAGHGGTLDPLATGLLPVLLNKATKLGEELLGSSKSYEGTFVLGYATDTQDITGKPIGEKKIVESHITVEFLNELTTQLTGNIQQVPPVYSALKKNGRPLYEYARAGETVVPESRPAYVKTFRIFPSPESNPAEAEFGFYVECGKGVYVRTLLHDLGILAGPNATMKTLRRLTVGDYSLDDARPLSYFTDPDKILSVLREI